MVANSTPTHRRLGDLLKETMEKVYDLPVRLDVDITIGDNWGEL